VEGCGAAVLGERCHISRAILLNVSIAAAVAGLGQINMVAVACLSDPGIVVVTLLEEGSEIVVAVLG
jgi:hypothetical protein